MLHSLNVVTCEAEMMRLVRFQRDLLRLAIKLANGATFTQDTLEVVFGAEFGQWFWGVCERGAVWKERITNLKTVLHPYSIREQVAVIVAFKHDIQFAENLTNNHWEFLYPQLPPPLKQSIKSLFEQCYDYFVDTGYTLNHTSPARIDLTRVYFLETFVEANSSVIVCPVCDSKLEKKVLPSGVKIPLLPLDHFFPKADYPFLSLHPYNLIPTCHNCNSYFKSREDPLANNANNAVASDALVHTYHSYRNRAILILDRLKAFRPPRPRDTLEIEIEDVSGTSARRIQTASRVYKLSQRWHDNIIEQVFEPLVLNLAVQAQENPSRSADDLKKNLEIERRKCCIGKGTDHTLKAAYLDYALADQQEQRYLLMAYQDRLTMM